MTIDDVKKKLEKLGLEIDRESGKILVEWEKIPFEEFDRPYWAALSSVDGVGPSTLPMLVAGFGSANAALNAAADELQIIGLSRNVSERIVRMGKNDIGLWFRHASSGLRFIVPKDDEFPKTLLELEHGPSQLWVWGDPSLLSFNRIVAVVGTRKISPYGKEVTSLLSQKLATYGCVIVSGLMYGVDEAAMRAGLSNQGKIIGVWAGGLTRSSLGSRYRLAADIVQRGGVVISEFSPDHVPQKGMFPARNRIVSGLSRGVVVTEGAIKSGSLITASTAMEQGKPVGAVPGPITSLISAGPNELLKLGATPVTTAEEILVMCGISGDGKKGEKSLFVAKNDIQKAIVSVLSLRPLTIDELARETKRSVSEIGEQLTELEMFEVVRQMGEEWKLV